MRQFDACEPGGLVYPHDVVRRCHGLRDSSACLGPECLFTRPELKVERLSYDVMTPSAARGILEAIH